MRIAFTVPGPVRGKGRPRARIRGRGPKSYAQIYTDEKTERYELAVKRFALLAMKGRKKLDGPIAISMTARLKPPETVSKAKKQRMIAGVELPTKKPDGDNILKFTDALNGVCFDDDSQIIEWRIIKKYDYEDGLDVVVEPYASADLFEKIETPSTEAA